MKELSTHEHPLHKHLISGQRFKVLIATVLLSIIGYFLFTLWGGWDNVVIAVEQVGAKGVAVAMGLSLINYALRFSRWQFFLKVLGQKVPWLPSLRIYMSGFSLTTTPGKTGEAIRGIFLKDYGVPFRKTFGAFFAERLSDLLSVAILACAGFWIYPKARPVLLLVATMVGFIFFAVQRDSWLRWIERMAKKLFTDKFAHVVEFVIEIMMSFRNCFTAKVLGTSLCFGVAAWLVEAFALYYILKLLGQDVSLLASIFIYGFSLVIGGITLLPGGLGGAEVTMLQMLIIQSVPPPVAVATTLVIRLTTLWFSVFLGIILLPKKQILWDSKS